MRVLETILPVLAMILLGMICKKIKLLNQKGIDNIKFLVTRILLPVAIFHALGTAEYSATTGLLVVIMLAMLILSFFIGYLLRPLIPMPYGKYVPFMVSVYEGGLMAYPLYTNLCGTENLSHIAILDIAGLLFGFSVYMGLLGQVENNQKIDVKKLCMDALRSPAFIAALLGIICGLSGILNILIAQPIGGTYLAIKNMITSPLNALILIVLGFDFEPNMKLMRPALKTIALRALLQTLMIAAVLMAVHHFIGVNQLTDLAIICYMSAPATFSMQSYLKEEQGSAYASTVNSIYCLITILVYMVLAVVL